MKLKGLEFGIKKLISNSLIMKNWKEIENFLRSELIGERVRVIKAKNKTLEGLGGEVYWETKNTFEIKTEKGIKKIPKSGTVFLFEGRRLKVEGEVLLGRPEERLKKRFRYW